MKTTFLSIQTINEVFVEKPPSEPWFYQMVALSAMKLVQNFAQSDIALCFSGPKQTAT